MKKEEFPSYLKLDLNSAKNFAIKNSIIPSELFKYTKVRNAKDLLYDNIMYLPQLSELNDPFEGSLLCDEGKVGDFYVSNNLDELMGYIEEELDGEDYDENHFKDLGKLCLRSQSYDKLSEIRRVLTGEIYVICLSGRKDITSLWAHYADNHRGICIEYDLVNTKTEIFKNLCFPIEYLEDYDLTRDVKYSFNKKSFNLNLKIKPLLLKAKDWSYEEEWRIIFDDSIKDFYPYEPYIKFLKPQKVYMGMDISEKDEKLIKNICKIKEIPLFKAIKDKDKYKFDFDEVDI
ncbi:DUF2971 domain-containing protein [Methanobrevibacter sp.]|uniref:DUF2971 domain-containing protein n=1 Tax=Methanobrevibacter sp. TaxID=66852 RepID=UPI00388DB015